MNNFKEKGYILFDLKKSVSPTYLKEELSTIQNSFDTLPEDSYAKGLNRYRRYSRAIINPVKKKVEWLPEVNQDGQLFYDYFQGTFNPEFTNSYRRFPAIENEVKNTTLLKDIILNDYNLTFWRKEDLLMPIHVGVHFVKLLVLNDGDVAISSPNELHQDGEPFTFAHLIERSNVSGGLNVIADTKSAGKLPDQVDAANIIESFTLDEPLKSYGVFDSKVSHYVGEITKGPDVLPGVRSVILIDFQPTIVPEPQEQNINDSMLVEV